MTYARLEDVPYSELKKGGAIQVATAPSYLTPGKAVAAVPKVGGGLYIVGDGDQPNPWAGWALIILLIKIIVGTICVIIVMDQFRRLWAIPEGKVTTELADGSKIYQAADGSTWKLSPDGTYTKMADAPSTAGEAIQYIVVAVVIIAIIVVVVKVLPFFQKKPQSTSG